MISTLTSGDFMKNSAEDQCIDKSNHGLHICQLTRKGLLDEVASRTENPGFVCHNCNASANRDDDLCNPSPLAKNQ